MYNKNIGRSLCRRRPVCLPGSAGLYAGIGRSLFQSRPVSMPAYGPYGPQGPWAQPLFDCVAEPFFFSGILGVQKNENVCVYENRCIFCDFCYCGKC